MPDISSSRSNLHVIRFIKSIRPRVDNVLIAIKILLAPRAAFQSRAKYVRLLVQSLSERVHENFQFVCNLVQGALGRRKATLFRRIVCNRIFLYIICDSKNAFMRSIYAFSNVGNLQQD